MKGFLLIICCFLVTTVSFSQLEKSFAGNNIFRSTCQPYNALADSIYCNSSSIWQVAQPVKSIINQAQQDQYALLTDSVNYYPTNDSSSFIIKMVDEGGFGDNVYNYPHTAYISGYYWSNTDSLNDYGTIELKMPGMNFWIDLLADSIYSYYWEEMLPAIDVVSWSGQKPVFSGNSNGWKSFGMNLVPLAEHYEVLYEDTLLFRFTFHSDSIQDSLDGLAFDELVLCDYVEGLDEYTFYESTIIPNPAQESITISFGQMINEPIPYSVENMQGELVQQGIISNTEKTINVSTLKPGIYLIHYLYSVRKKVGRARFVKTH